MIQHPWRTPGNPSDSPVLVPLRSLLALLASPSPQASSVAAAMKGVDKFETYYSILGVERTASTEEICK